MGFSVLDTIGGIKTTPIQTLYPATGRLSLTSGSPVTTSDVTAATTLYYALLGGGVIALYDGTRWNLRTFSELSIAIPASTNTNYDVFVYDNAGSPTLELLAWTNDTTRATALTKQDGVYVKTGATTRRYVGTIRTTGTSGQCEDSVTKRYVWNYYNRVKKTLVKLDLVNTTWTYTTATWRQARADSANKFEFVIGVAEEPIEAFLYAVAENTSANVFLGASLALDVTTNPDNDTQGPTFYTQVANIPIASISTLRKHVVVGYHYIAWIEYSTASGTTTWHGSNEHCGIVGLLIG